MKKQPQDIYELLENDNNEIMVLLYAVDSAPQDPSFTINEKRSCMILHRNPEDNVSITGLALETFQKLKKLDTLYVCEMNYSEDENEENKIVYAYQVPPKKEDNKAIKEETLSEKAKKASEKLKKASKA